MLTCKELIDFLIDYTDGTLSPEVRGEFDRHLSVCPSCRAYLDSYQRTISLARRAVCNEDAAEMPPPAPEELVQSVLEARKKQA
ncbi:MAG: anti-sigma factor family protein [Phycisphaerales bacterium]